MARIAVPGTAYHVTRRGNGRQRTFFRKDDYQAYVELMAEWCGRCGVGVWGKAVARVTSTLVPDLNRRESPIVTTWVAWPISIRCG